MKREFLEKLGLGKAAIDSIMAEHGKTIGALKEEKETAEKEKEAAQMKAKQFEQEIKTRDADIENLQKTAKDNEELQGQLTTLQEKYNESNMNHAIAMALKGSVHDVDIVASQLDRSALKLGEDGTIDGLDAQVQALKESKSFLFIPAEDPATTEPERAPQAHIVGATPKGTNTGQEVTPQQQWMDAFTADIQH